MTEPSTTSPGFPGLVRLSVVSFWLLTLAAFHEIYADEPAFLEDTWTREHQISAQQLVLDHIPSSETVKAGSHVVIFKESSTKNGARTVRLEEIRSYSSALALTDPNLQAIRREIDNVPALDRVIALSRDPDISTRYAVFSSAKGLPSWMRVYHLSRVLKYALAIHLAASLIVAIWGAFRLSGDSNASARAQEVCSIVTVISVALIGVYHGIFIYIQGGLILSPMGMLTAAVFPVVVSQSVLFISSSSPGIRRKVALFIPPVVFGAAAVIGHVAASESVDSSAKIVMAHMFDSQYLIWYIIAVLLSGASFQGGDRTEPVSQL